MIDTFSKFAVVVKMKGKTKENVLAAVMEGMTKMGRRPKMLYCDRDKTFTGKLLEEQCQKENIKLIFTHTHPPVVERFNRTFKSMIWKRLKADKTREKTWTVFIFDVVSMYNATVHTSTGMTPMQAKEAKNTLQVKVNLEMQRHSTRTYPEIKVGDRVKLFYKKPLQKAKEHLSNWSEETYTVSSTSTSFNQTYYHLNGYKIPVLRHDLLKVP